MENVVDAISRRIDGAMTTRDGSVMTSVMLVTWISVSTVDSNLSVIQFPGAVGTKDYIPKLSGVPALSSGDTVMVIRGGSCPWTIIGKFVGNITLFAGQDSPDPSPPHSLP